MLVGGKVLLETHGECTLFVYTFLNLHHISWLFRRREKKINSFLLGQKFFPNVWKTKRVGWRKHFYIHIIFVHFSFFLFTFFLADIHTLTIKMPPKKTDFFSSMFVSLKLEEKWQKLNIISLFACMNSMLMGIDKNE